MIIAHTPVISRQLGVGDSDSLVEGGLAVLDTYVLDIKFYILSGATFTDLLTCIVHGELGR